MTVRRVDDVLQFHIPPEGHMAEIELERRDGHERLWLVLVLAPSPCMRPMVRSVLCLACAVGLMGAGSRADAQRPLPPPSTAGASLRTAQGALAADSGRAGPTNVIVSTTASASQFAASAAVQAAAEITEGVRLVVSVEARRLWWLDGPDTLFSAPVAVGKGSTLQHGTTVWDFSSPVSIRRVHGKSADPIWVPPDWHYVELAEREGLQLSFLRRSAPVRLQDGRVLSVRGEMIGLASAEGQPFAPLPRDEEVVFDGTLYVPPFGTVQRRIVGELGGYKLNLGDGYLLHGTRDQSTIGTASTHGCFRLRDADIAHLYEHVPTGTRVFIY